MREIKEILKDLRQAEKTASTNLNEVAYSARQGIGMAIRRAQDVLPGLREELKAAIIPSKLNALFAEGPDSIVNKVAEFVESEGGIVVDANMLYRKIAKAIEPSYGANRFFSTQQFFVMMREIREVGIELGYRELPAPQADGQAEVLCTDEDKTAMHVRNLIRKNIGDELSRKYFIHVLTEKVVSKVKNERPVAILVLDVLSAEEKAGLIVLFANSNTYKFPTNFIINKANVAKLFKNSQSGDSAEKGEKEEKGE